MLASSSQHLSQKLAEKLFPDPRMKEERDELMTVLSVLVVLAKREALADFESATLLATYMINAAKKI